MDNYSALNQAIQINSPVADNIKPKLSAMGSDHGDANGQTVCIDNEFNGSDIPSQDSGKAVKKKFKRHRLSRKERAFLYQLVVEDYKDGVPTLEIMIRRGLNEKQVKDMLLDAISDRVVAPTSSKYQFLPTNSPLYNINALKDVEYVRAFQNDNGEVVLIPFKEE